MKKEKKPLLIPPTYFYIFSILAISVRFIFPQTTFVRFPVSLLGLVLIIFGFWLIIYSWQLFQKNNTPENYKDQSTCLVTENIYQYSRNPMYVGTIFVLIGIGIFTGSYLSFIFPVLFWIVMNYSNIPFEEAKMEKEFGKKFQEYKNQTRRWI
jgi:protein-S-isoprenylcysteine O-methyltransferase Ste14